MPSRLAPRGIARCRDNRWEEIHEDGAVGCSGGTGSQDEATCMTAAATVNKKID